MFEMCACESLTVFHDLLVLFQLCEVQLLLLSQLLLHELCLQLPQNQGIQREDLLGQLAHTLL